MCNSWVDILTFNLDLRWWRVAQIIIFSVSSQRSLTPVVGREDCQLEEFCGQPKWTSSSNDAKQDFPSQQPSSNYHSLQSHHSELLLSQSPTNSDCSDNDWLARDLGITAGTDEKQAFASAYDSLKNPSSQNNWWGYNSNKRQKYSSSFDDWLII